MRCVIFGTGGTGGAVGSFMARAGKDVTFIARGRHLEAMRGKGLRVIKPDEEFMVRDVKACSAEEYIELLKGASGEGAGPQERPDVIFICVKGYSVDDAVRCAAEAAGPETIVIPVLNLYGTGAAMQEQLPGVLVTDGCIYVASEIREPGVILMKGSILRVVFGLRREDSGKMAEYGDKLRMIRDDLVSSGIAGQLSDNIERDALRKFSYVSPQGACGLYYDIPVGPMQRPGEERECMAALIGEIQQLAQAMGIEFGGDVVSEQLAILDKLDPTMTTSLQRDVAAGKAAEFDGLIGYVVRKADELGLDLPVYRKIAAELEKRMEAR